MNLLSALARTARALPNKPFVRHQGQTTTYGQALDRSRRAAALLASQGIGPGDRVALVCLNTPGFIDAMLGAWRLGAAVVPVNHKLAAPEIEYILAHCSAKAVVFDAALAPVLDKVQSQAARFSTAGAVPAVPDFDALLADTTDGIDGIAVDEDAVAEILYTSGTTGKPKGCLHSHRNVTMAAIGAALSSSMTPAERTLMAMPIWHSSPLNNWFGCTLYVGGTVVLLREYHPQHFLQTVQDERVTLYFGAPVSYFAPLQAVPDFARYDLSSVRAWIYGGGPIGADMARKLVEAYKTDRFFQVFGMTETGPTGTTLLPEEQLAKAGSIGRLGLPGVELRVVRKDGEEAGPGDIGEIWLRCESLMLGYLDDEAATRAAVTKDGWYRSGDLVRLDEDGYLFVVDRTKDMIVTGGENVYSKEVEDALSAQPAIADVAVVGRPHPEWGETVVAHVVLRKNAPPTDADALRDYLAPRLAKYKIPREYVFVDALPRTSTGKLQKYMLRA
ncbi:MAG: AMP-binding protein [Proteobacteria bacterium]|nr:AMP-binding protein [Pseudomonadota bacterium]